MKSNHYVTLAMFLAAIAGMLSGLDHWSDALHPPFVAGFLAAVASLLKAMYEEKPSHDDGAGSVTVGGR